MSKNVAIAKNAKARRDLLVEANSKWQALLVATRVGDEEKLATLDFNAIHSACDELEDCKRRMRSLQDEYAELTAL